MRDAERKPGRIARAFLGSDNPLRCTDRSVHQRPYLESAIQGSARSRYTNDTGIGLQLDVVVLQVHAVAGFVLFSLNGMGELNLKDRLNGAGIHQGEHHCCANRWPGSQYPTYRRILLHGPPNSRGS